MIQKNVSEKATVSGTTITVKAAETLLLSTRENNIEPPPIDEGVNEEVKESLSGRPPGGLAVLSTTYPSAGYHRRGRGPGLDPDGQVQQVQLLSRPCRRLRPGGLPGRLPQDTLPGRLYGGCLEQYAGAVSPPGGFT